jgi:hypothetical protein
LEDAQGAILPVFEWVNSHPGVNVSTTDVLSSEPVFTNLGLAISDFVDSKNFYIVQALQQNDSTIISTGQLQDEMILIYDVLYVSTTCPSPSKYTSIPLL